MKKPPDETDVSRGEPPGPGRSHVAVPGYEILEELGRGGMGVVYKARHEMMDRLVALKLILGDRLGDPDAGRRFLREIRAVAKLRHPHVVLAHDAGRVGGDLFLVMEFVEGTDLRRLLHERGPLPVSRACAFVRQAALGLQHAWEHGLVHRDVKPANLLLSRAGVVKVSDFGLVCLRAATPLGPSGPTLTADHVVLGTPAFMAPEQVLDARATDCRADLYSLGCTLYQLLTGRPPFPQAGPELIAAHLTRQPEPVERVRPDVPGAVADVVCRLLAKKPEQRYQTPAELAAALAPFAGGDAGAASTTADLAARKQSTLPTRPAKGTPLRRRPWWAAGVLGGLLAAALSAVAIWRALSPPEDPSPSAVAPAPPETEAEARAALRAQGGALIPDRAGEPVIRIRLAGPRVTDDTLKHLRAFPSLQELVFDHEVAQVTAAGLAPVAGLTNLRFVDLGNLGWVTDEALRHLSGLKNLETLHLHNTHVGDDGLAHLKNLYRLNTLYLYGTRVTDRGLVHLHGLRNLNYLNLKGLPLSDRALRELKQALPGAEIDR